MENAFMSPSFSLLSAIDMFELDLSRLNSSIKNQKRKEEHVILWILLQVDRNVSWRLSSVGRISCEKQSTIWYLSFHTTNVLFVIRSCHIIEIVEAWNQWSLETCHRLILEIVSSSFLYLIMGVLLLNHLISSSFLI